MKKKALLILPLLLGLASCNIAKDQTNIRYQSFNNATDTHVDDGDWSIAAGTTRACIGSGDETYFLGLTSSGQHGYYKYKVHVDGLDITWRAEGLPKQSTMSGFYFAPNTSQYYGKISVSMWKGLYSNQTRVHVGNDHNYNETSLAYKDSNCTTTGFSVANSMVMTTSDSITHAGFRLQINSYNASTFKLQFTPVYEDSPIWSNNANYSSADKSSTVYVPKSTIDCMDANGDVYLHFFGFDTNGVQSGFIPYITLSDNNIKAYKEETVDPVYQLLVNYISKMNNATTKEAFEEALALREQYLNSLSSLRAHDQYVYAHEKLEWADSLVASKAASFAYQEIDNQFNVVDDVISSFAMENNLTEASLNNFVNQINTAKEVHETYKNLLLDSQKEICLEKIEEYEYLIHYYKALLWVLTIERMIDAISPTSSSVASDLDDIYSFIEEDMMNEEIRSLDAEDNLAINNRIANNQARLLELFDTYRTNIIDEYLIEWNKLLNKDLTNKENLLSAISYYKYINSRLTLVNADTKYDTYQSYLTKLINASDKYITQTINSILGLYDENILLLEQYQPVKEAYSAFNFDDFIFVESANYNDLVAKYNSLTETVQSNALFFFDAYGVTGTQLGKNGVYFDSIGAYPARLNYNQPLSFNQGIDIDIVCEEMAFYNDGTKANNISINFLNKNNEYKGEVGISFVIWVYQKNSNVKLYNLVDGEIGACSITTPNSGETLNIDIKSEVISGELTYLIKVCDGTITVKDSLLKQCGLDVNDTTYFSIGTFLDDKTYPNSFSIKRINDKDFSRQSNIVKEDNPDME